MALQSQLVLAQLLAAQASTQQQPPVSPQPSVRASTVLEALQHQNT
jgi:hypothetical protein